MSTQRSKRSPRWDLFGPYRVRVDGKLFIKRRRIIQCPLFAVLFSRIYFDDSHRKPHNHSRSFWTLAVTGSYTERVWIDPKQLDKYFEREHSRMHLVRVRRTEAHQIIEVRGKLRTLVFAGRFCGPFYFYGEGGEEIAYTVKRRGSDRLTSG